MAQESLLGPDDNALSNAAAPAPTGSGSTAHEGSDYVVVARRYRPQTFEELIGQEHVARGLAGAIQSHRVGHAYLFTGVRGVGKTSAARILAKALNCEYGPTPTPCNQCDICRTISSGDDIDVLEIDGASNRGIDEIRQLRQNVNVRPSRSRYKVYIIDEVHMLTREAFNALLKTLEEPPEHVKFVFCTTEAEKIPVTILSRCQRYDFAGISTDAIARRLRQIVEAEGIAADDEALTLLARRAAGSMRDSQSLLEQLLSLGTQQITVESVHALLGTAGDTRLTMLVAHLNERNPAGALAELDAAMSEGVDVGQLLDQLLGYFRDVMIAAAGCPAENYLHTGPAEHAQVASAGKQLGLATILAALQILDHTLTRLRFSAHGRILAELALVRIAKLDELDKLADVIAELREGAPPVGSAGSANVAGVGMAKKKAELNTGSASPRTVALASANIPANIPVSPQATRLQPSPVNADDEAFSNSAAGEMGMNVLTPENALEMFRAAAVKLGDMTADSALQASIAAIRAPNQLVVSFPAKYNFGKSICENPDRAARLEQALVELVGRRIKLEFVLENSPVSDRTTAAAPQRGPSARERQAELMKNPLVRRAAELFDARPVARE
jgi:DNA polymerase-3 subunit gamma/tau